jgi:hypothetical protein
MKSLSFRAIVAGALAFLVCPGVASALDLTLFFGGAVPGKLTTDLVVSPATTYRELTSGPIFGVRLNTNLAKIIGLEHTLAFSTDYLTPRSILNPQNANGFVYNTNLTVNIPVKKFVPYGTIGLGLVYQYGYPNAPIGLRFAINYGGGIKFLRLIGPVGLRFDLRGYRAMGIPLVSSEASLNIFEASGGVVFSFAP